MVKGIIKNKRKYFICERCGFIYKKKEIAEKCQKFCSKYNSCSLEITKNAVWKENIH